MTIALLILAAVILLLVNMFFVFAEFAAVKLRGSRIEELIEQGHPRAALAKRVHDHLDEYLSVVQVGITLASIALGFVGQQLTADLIIPLVQWAGPGSEVVAQLIGTIVGVALVSGVHIILGEQVPKLLAVRYADRVALITSGPLVWCRTILWLPLWFLNGSAQLIIRWMGLPAPRSDELHSEDEIRIILDRSQESGLMSFRRLLFIENIFDLDDLKVKDAMRPRSQVKCIDQRKAWTDNEQVIRASRYSRFPVITDDNARPVGMVHVKDLFYACSGGGVPDIVKLMRPCHVVTDTQPLEQVLSEMQRKRQQIALVLDAKGQWSGLLTFEDIVEEIIGTVTDEFEVDPPMWLSEVLTPGCVVLGLEADSVPAAIRAAISRVPAADLPMPADLITRAVLERERLAPTYLGRGIAMPHARIKDLEKPVLIFVRSLTGIPLSGQKERAQMLFILLTPAGQPRVHQKLQARIAGILENSDYVDDRLREATTAQEVLDVIRTGEQAALG
ncbi:MAG: CNNM domain-containing protein [Planctomycetota bacterium]